MLDAVKLVIIAFFLLCSSKAYGEYLNKRWKMPFNSTLGLGYLTNLALFFLVSLPVMLLKLSTSFLVIFGIIYLLISFYVIVTCVIDKTLFKIKKVDLIILFFSVLLLLLYYFCLDFGVIETYDSYFYSALTNNAANSEGISVVDPYSGLSNLQNFYKYMSYYYMPSFFSVLFHIKHAYLILIWTMTFMNFVLIFDTAFVVCRISNKKYVNNILSAFYLTLILSLIRAPFNALHLTTFVVSIYIFRMSFQMFKGKTGNVIYLIITVLASISFTSTSLFTLLPFIFILFITNTFVEDKVEYKKLFLIAIPVILLGFIYIFESLKEPIVLFIAIILCAFIYKLFTYLWFNVFVKYACYLLTILVFLFFVLAEPLHMDKMINQYFMQSTAIKESEIISIDEQEDSIKSCLGNNNLTVEEHDSMYEYKTGLGSSINYMIGNGDNTITKIFILLTHSLPKYGGLVFLAIYGFLYRRKQYNFISFVLYLIMFNNPFVSAGLNLVTFGLSSRIILFFNTYFALIGIKYFFEFIYDLKQCKKLTVIFDKSLFPLSILYGGLVCASIFSFSWQLRPDDYKDYNFLYKTKDSIVQLEKGMNNIKQTSLDKKPRFFFTQSAFNATMIDSSGEDKVLVMNSKEFMNYLFERNIITDKTMINDYFESQGKYNFNSIIKICKNFSFDDDSAVCNCNINDLLKFYGVDYVVTKKPSDKRFYNQLRAEYNLLYENDDYIILNV